MCDECVGDLHVGEAARDAWGLTWVQLVIKIPGVGEVMHKTNLCKVDGSVMLAVPPAFLDQMHLQVGATVAGELL